MSAPNMFKVRHILRTSALLLMWFVAGCATTTNCPARSDDVQDARVDIVHESGRTSTVALWAPQMPGEYPLMVFSHGAFSAPERYTQALSLLAAEGFIVAAPLHVDSELMDAPPPEPPVVWATRLEDLRRLPDERERLQKGLRGVRIAPPSEGYLAAGHSYGAFMAQVVAGANAVADTSEAGADPRIRAVIGFSPPGPLPRFIEADAWNAMSVPQLILTGTADVLPGFIDDWTLHATAYHRAQPGDQWLWVGEGVDHYFGRLLGRLTLDVPPQDAAFAGAMGVARHFARHYGAAKTCGQALVPFSNDIAKLSNR